MGRVRSERRQTGPILKREASLPLGIKPPRPRRLAFDTHDWNCRVGVLRRLLVGMMHPCPPPLHLCQADGTWYVCIRNSGSQDRGCGTDAVMHLQLLVRSRYYHNAGFRQGLRIHAP